MGESNQSLPFRLWYVAVCLLIFFNLLVFTTGIVGANSKTGKAMGLANSQHILDHVAIVARQFGNDITKTGFKISTSISATMKTVSHNAQKATAATGYGITRGMVAVLQAPADVASFAVSTAAASSFIRPADSIHPPVIDASVPIVPVAQSATKASVAAAPAAQVSSTIAQWPLHGRITTYFGAPDFPYEAVHTGLDITDGMHSSIVPFRPGRVVEVVHSYAGLGNHIVIDHGSGVKSVYGHLYSTAVSVGQQVDESTVLGYEGSTGASTGIHLHFEIWVNGMPVNPLSMISGRP